MVHEFGHLPFERFIVFALVPIEAATFVGAVAASGGGPILWVLGGLYLASEAFRTLQGGFVVTALRPQGQSLSRSSRKVSIKRGGQSYSPWMPHALT